MGISVRLGDGFKNPEIIEMKGFGLSHEQIKILLYQIEAEQIPRAFEATYFP